MIPSKILEMYLPPLNETSKSEKPNFLLLIDFDMTLIEPASS